MKSREYIEKIVDELTSQECMSSTSLRGAFLGAALEIIREVGSPLKEEALVTLATLELAAARRVVPPLRKIA